MSRRAIIALDQLLSPNAELLPIDVPPNSSGFEYEYFAVNVTSVLDCLDHARSRFTRYSTGRIMKIERYSFVEQKISGMPIFKIPESALVSVFVSADFRSAYLDADLTGLRFDRIYPPTLIQRLKEKLISG